MSYEKDSDNSKIQNILLWLIEQLEKDIRIINSYRDWFDYKKQEQVVKPNKININFRKKFQKYEHHALTIQQCHEVMEQLEEKYYYLATREDKNPIATMPILSLGCNTIYETVREIVDYFDRLVLDNSLFNARFLYRALRALSLKSTEYLSNVRKIHEANLGAYGQFSKK